MTRKLKHVSDLGDDPNQTIAGTHRLVRKDLLGDALPPREQREAMERRLKQADEAEGLE